MTDQEIDRFCQGVRNDLKSENSFDTLKKNLTFLVRHVELLTTQRVRRALLDSRTAEKLAGAVTDAEYRRIIDSIINKGAQS